MALRDWDHVSPPFPQDGHEHGHGGRHHGKPHQEHGPEHSAVCGTGRNIYFLVPTDEIDEESDHVGTFFRLGEYSDVEVRASRGDRLDELYPEQHISDEGGEQGALDNASGGAEGILLSCDGRILIKAQEKIYLQSADFHQSVEGDYALDVDGEIDISADEKIRIASADGAVTVKSGGKNTLKLSADGGSGKLELVGKDHERTVKGDTTERFHGPVDIQYKDSISVKKFGWDFTEVYGMNMDTYYGAKCESIYGLRMQFDKYNMVSNWGSFNWIGTQVDLKAMVMKRVTAKFGSSNCTAEWNEIMVGLEHLKVGSNQVEARQRAVSLDSGQVDVKSGNSGVRMRAMSCYI